MTSIQTPNIAQMQQPKKRAVVYEGKNKLVYQTGDSNFYALYFKDLGNDFPGKAVIHNRLSELLFTRLANIGIENHFVKRINMFEQLVCSADPLMFNIKVHNVLPDNLLKKFNLENSQLVKKPWIEFHIKGYGQSDSLLSEQQIVQLNWASEEEIQEILETTSRINDYLCGQFEAVRLRLDSFQLEFGRISNYDFPEFSRLILIDELSTKSISISDPQNPDNSSTHMYQTVAYRLGIIEDLPTTPHK